MLLSINRFKIHVKDIMNKVLVMLNCSGDVTNYALGYLMFSNE